MSEEKKYNISLTEKNAVAPNREAIKNKAPYNTTTETAAQNIAQIDKFDIFGRLNIDVKNYIKKDGSEYGIDYNPSIHVDRSVVVLPHQQKAAEAFLRELRGFGLLADNVGSGKTFEACVVLSELAVRGKMQSLLLVVPEQTFAAWKNVLENKFGLGKGVLFEGKPSFKETFIAEDVGVSLKNDNVEGEEIYRPARPVIVTTEIFAG